MLAFAGMLSAQNATPVDFARDVQPLLRQNCVGCHGPAMQQAGLRFDRKSSVLKEFSRRVVPGNSANSMVYHRLVGSQYGPQMPPTGALRTEQIAVIKAWIDQGAVWPDSLSNEAPPLPLDPKAISLVESLRNAHMDLFLKTVSAEPALLNARGPEGSTPFMYAVLYANTATLTHLLKLGADPNKSNDAHATALMWAIRDLDKTRLLIEHGADVNAKSDDYRTPLMIAARHPGNLSVVKLLLEKGANPNPNPIPPAQGSPLLDAAAAGDAATTELLLQKGAEAPPTGEFALATAAQADCMKCVELLAAKITDKAAYTGALQDDAYLGDAKLDKLFLDHGADVNAFDGFGHSPLMYSVLSDIIPVEAVKLLIAHGADINAASRHKKGGDENLTILDIARQNGRTPIVELLEKAGAKASTLTPVALKPRQNNTIRAAVQDSLPLIQRADANFSKGAACVSCHDNSLAAMAVGTGRKRGLPVDESTASGQVKFNAQILEKTRDKLHQLILLPVGDTFSDSILAYQLIGMHAENYKDDLNTDAVVLHLLGRQRPNGEWQSPHADGRPPICLEFIGQTAKSMRAIQLYAPKALKPEADKAIQLAATWIANAKSWNHEDRVWRLTGLAWAGNNKPALEQAKKELLATQRPDGGWSDMPTMESSAYDTGHALVALHTAGMPATDPAYQRGVRYLLSTQQEDGSWFVKSRALGFQPYFDAGFPHGYNQWMSVAGTSWAVTALALTLPESHPVASIK
jgi:ankyrin repeat protein